MERFTPLYSFCRTVTDNTIKLHLDKFWSDQDVLYNYEADLQGIGNHCIIFYISETCYSVITNASCIATG